MNAARYINLFTALFTFVLGILILTGIIFPENKDTSKILFGIVLIIYGIFRFVNLMSKLKQSKMDERHEKLIEEKEKLLHKNES